MTVFFSPGSRSVTTSLGLTMNHSWSVAEPPTSPVNWSTARSSKTVVASRR